jgi:hypothetical protein
MVRSLASRRLRADDCLSPFFLEAEHRSLTQQAERH